ncbi:MAG TPA: aquaporin [Gaiellaceae bacterium]|jgi:aquaporin Z|nr:aquaporin [Gaiellaceae bacterium]
MPPAGDYFRRASAEFVGTFALVFVAAGSFVFLRTLTDVGLAYGLIVAVMVSAVGPISGGHFNPAVTLGFLVTRRIAPSLALIYWVTQFVASIAAAALLRWVLPGGAADSIQLGAPKLGSEFTAGHGVVIEAVLTFFLVWVFFATTADPRGTFKQVAGLAIGLTITADVLMAGAMTGAAMNPARALGPELIGNHWKDAWVWYLGPFAGAAVAAVVYELLYLRPARPLPVGPPETGLEEPRPGDTALS